MKITAINGSPRGKKGNTYLMVEEFFKGAREEGAETEHVLLSEMKIHPCRGCFSCWVRTPGVCILKDDMQKILDLTANADIIIYATPLYVDNVSGLLKNFMDRSIPGIHPSFEKDINGETVHPKRRKIRPQKMMVMANCGYPGSTHFEVLKVLFRRVARNAQNDLIAEIYRDQGSLLTCGNKDLETIVKQYKTLLQKAGRELAQNSKISKQTQKELDQELIPFDLYIQNHNDFFRQFEIQ